MSAVASATPAPKRGDVIDWTKLEARLSTVAFLGGTIAKTSDWTTRDKAVASGTSGVPYPLITPGCAKWYSTMTTLKKTISEEVKKKPDEKSTTATTAKEEKKIVKVDNRVRYPSIEPVTSDMKSTASMLWIQEKLNGSQFTFELSTDHSEVLCYNKGRRLTLDDALFYKAIRAVNLESVRSRLAPGAIYDGECIQSLNPNGTQYGRMPRHYVILYDIRTADNKRLTPTEVVEESGRIGFESVPVIQRLGALGGASSSYMDLNHSVMYMDVHTALDVTIAAMEDGKIVSCLGGKPEGVVIKPGYRKLVCPCYREASKTRRTKPIKATQSAILEWIAERYDVPGRFAKAQSHLRDNAKLAGVVGEDTTTSSPIIPVTLLALQEELDTDLAKEWKHEICELLRMEFPTESLLNSDELWVLFGGLVAPLARKSLVAWFSTLSLSSPTSVFSSSASSFPSSS